MEDFQCVLQHCQSSQVQDQILPFMEMWESDLNLLELLSVGSSSNESSDSLRLLPSEEFLQDANPFYANSNSFNSALTVDELPAKVPKKKGRKKRLLSEYNHDKNDKESTFLSNVDSTRAKNRKTIQLNNNEFNCKANVYGADNREVKSIPRESSASMFKKEGNNVKNIYKSKLYPTNSIEPRPGNANHSSQPHPSIEDGIQNAAKNPTNNSDVLPIPRKRKYTKASSDASFLYLSSKERHNMKEKRRREHINAQLKNLKEMIPSCRKAIIDRAGLLQHASTYIAHLENEVNDQKQTCTKLCTANSMLTEEINDLKKRLSICYPVLREDIIFCKSECGSDTSEMTPPSSPVTSIPTSPSSTPNTGCKDVDFDYKCNDEDPFLPIT